MRTSEAGAAAKEYAERGYSVFPCRPNAKTPLTPRGFKDATLDKKQIETWWRARPDANVAIRTDGMLVVDVDGPADIWLPSTDGRWRDLDGVPCSQTPRGGRHFFFRRPSGKAWRNSQGKLAHGVDTRTDGGYVVVPPSKCKLGCYRWSNNLMLQVPPEGLPEPPPWLVDQLDALTNKTRIRMPSGVGAIAEGQRNATMTSIAGTMRRRGMGYHGIVSALHRENVDRCQPPLPYWEVDQIAASVSRYEPGRTARACALPTPTPVGSLIAAHSSLRAPIIHDLLRLGETMNLIAPPKTKKSWMATDLAIAIASGSLWLGTFQTERSRALMIDNELHAETIAHRIPQVAAARGIPIESLFDHLSVLPLRGHLRDVNTLQNVLDNLEPDRYQLIVLDALYRVMPPEMDENNNVGMTRLYDQIDEAANRLKCAFVLVHHTSKGNQAGKVVTDVGAGAGSQSRATDTHLVLRPHHVDGVVVLDATTRSWPPVQSRCLRWQHPVWIVDASQDPRQLRRSRSSRGSSNTNRGDPTEQDAREFVDQHISSTPRERRKILESAKSAGMSERRCVELLKTAQTLGILFYWDGGKFKQSRYASVPKPGLTDLPSRT